MAIANDIAEKNIIASLAPLEFVFTRQS